MLNIEYIYFNEDQCEVAIIDCKYPYESNIYAVNISQLLFVKIYFQINMFYVNYGSND